jgi:hypothetical protein
MGYIIVPLALAGVGLWAWLQYLVVKLAMEKDYPLPVLMWMQPPLISLWILSRLPDPPAKESRLGVEALTAIMDAKTRRLEAEWATAAAPPPSNEVW